MIFNSNKVIVSFDEDVPCVIWQPINFVKGEDFRVPFEKGIDFFEENIEKYPNMTWLNDARNLKTVAIEDVLWLNKNVNDRVKQFGKRKVGFVLPENIFGQWAIKKYIDVTSKRSDNTLDIKAFTDIDEAKSWLKS